MQFDDGEGDGSQGDAMGYEVFEDALRECIRACGGTKAVGKMLRPLKTVESAQQWVLACLNENRDEKFGADDILGILKAARDRGCHVGMAFLCARLSYAPPQPVKPADESDELKRQFLKAAAQMQKLSDRIFEMAQREATVARPRDLGSLQAMRSGGA